MQTSDFGGLQEGTILAAQRDLEALFAFSDQLSLEPVTKDTTNCADTQTNERFTQLARAAELSLQAALDDVDGPTLTHFDTALDELRQARLQFFRNVAGNRANSHFHVDNAHQAFASGITEFIN